MTPLSINVAMTHTRLCRLLAEYRVAGVNRPTESSIVPFTRSCMLRTMRAALTASSCVPNMIANMYSMVRKKRIWTPFFRDECVATPVAMYGCASCRKREMSAPRPQLLTRTTHFDCRTMQGKGYQYSVGRAQRGGVWGDDATNHSLSAPRMCVPTDDTTPAEGRDHPSTPTAL